jgi:hypothetical protein
MTTTSPQSLPIQAVLDRSALESYARGHVHVGELIIEIADDGANVGIPAAALLDAHVRFIDDEHARALLGLIVTLPGTEVLDMDAPVASSMADTVPLADDDVSRAHSVWAAKQHVAHYLTTEPGEVTELLPPDQVHAIPVKDA